MGDLTCLLIKTGSFISGYIPTVLLASKAIEMNSSNVIIENLPAPSDRKKNSVNPLFTIICHQNVHSYKHWQLTSTSVERLVKMKPSSIALSIKRMHVNDL